MDQFATDVIVSELETQLQSKLLIEFPVFPFNDDCMKTLGSILGQKLDALKLLCKSRIEQRQQE